MKKQCKPIIFYFGMLAFATGMLLKFLLPEADGTLKILPFVLSGFGAGIIGVGVASMFAKKIRQKDPEAAKRYEIEEMDERNIRLREKAGLSTWYITTFTLAFLSLGFVVFEMNVAALFSMAALLLHIVCLFVFIYVYNRKI